MTARYRAAIIGCGDIGHAHAQGYVANPEVELWAGGRGGTYRAHEADEEERDRLWRLATQLYPGYDDYQRKADAAGRRIPVVVCEPLDP